MKRCSKLILQSKVVFSYIKQQISLQGILYLKAMPIFVFFFATAFLLAYLTDRYIEAFFQVVAFLFLRYKFDTTYHARTTQICFFITLSVVILSVPTIPCLESTLFGGIFSAFMVSFISWLAQYIVDLKSNQVVKTKFNTDTCTENELLARCKELHFNDENTQLSVEFFIKRTKQSVLAERLCIEEKSITTRKKRLKEKLNKN